ncbi:hypothetical protein FB446DRAFT_490040 [Lentinula raphanica]|nr:hypothetical protein C8R42DRAFT_478506 [Lentinula raphanica]KAJ3774228.1 hypothetical protein FB446DRAFT_490040 [Lentinula raphanica]
MSFHRVTELKFTIWSLIVIFYCPLNRTLPDFCSKLQPRIVLMEWHLGRGALNSKAKSKILDPSSQICHGRYWTPLLDGFNLFQHSEGESSHLRVIRFVP